jgi:hypothetical protein
MHFLGVAQAAKSLRQRMLALSRVFGACWGSFVQLEYGLHDQMGG